MTTMKTFQSRRPLQPEPEDVSAITTFVEGRGERIVSITRNDDPLYYWLRGKLLISNLARFFVVVTESSDGRRSALHFAFDPWSKSKGMQLLLEKPVRGND